VPELPEVAALADALTTRASGLRVARVDVAAISALKTVDPPVSATLGSDVLGFSRLGKHLVLDLVDPDGEALHLVIHLARGGWIRWRDDPPSRPAPLGGRRSGSALALRIVLASPPTGPEDAAGTPVAAVDITEAGTQKRLAVHVVRDPALVPGVARLGPDPLDEEFDVRALRDVLSAAGRAQIKGVLRDQSRIAGIGNAYSDEILHAARLSPFTPASSLTDEAQAALHRAIRSTLTEAVTVARATDPASLKAEKHATMAVHGRTGEPCPVCGDLIREVSFADSSLQYCPTCQTGGRLLADRRMSRLLK
jgi:formamidopyrimidine-DNA glycosylase